MNASSKNGTLGTLGQFHPPKVGIGAKCDSENLQNSHFQKFQAFHIGDHMVFIAFLCYSGHFTYQGVPKVPFLLGAFTYIKQPTVTHAAKSLSIYHFIDHITGLDMNKQKI